MFKLGTIGAIFQAHSNPRAIAIADTKIGNVYKIVDGYSATIQEGAVAFATDAEVKLGNVNVCLNIVDVPELWKLADFKVSAGSPLKSVRLDSVISYTVEISSDLVTTAYASVAVGDVLIPCNSTDDAATPLNWKKAATPTGYKVGLKVLEKTAFGGTGFFCKIVTV